MCSQKPPYNFSQQLYDKYKDTFDEYLKTTVLPSLREKHDEFMLRELIERWLNHKVMVRWLSRFFHYLDRFFVAQHSLPGVRAVGLTCFRDSVYMAIRANARKALIALIDKEREGEQIDRSLLKNAIDVFVEIGFGETDQYQQDFEVRLLEDTVDYYKSKATDWIEIHSCPDYMLKAEDCLRRERDRVAHYLHGSTEPKLVEKVQHELLVTHANQLLEKENSGFRALLKDNKGDDLSRMYRLYHKIPPEGLDLVANVFKQHITAEGTELVQQAEEAASNQTTSGSGIQEQASLLNVLVIEYIILVIAGEELTEAFEIFCNKTVAGSSIAEVLATFCDNILKESGSERLSDKAIEETLQKVVMLLPCINDKDLFADFYRKKLARRLLFDWSDDYYFKSDILTSELEQICSNRFIEKMEGMEMDLMLASGGQMEFEEYLRHNSHANPGIDLKVIIITAKFWPSYKPFDLHLPSEMIRCLEAFKGFYNTKKKDQKTYDVDLLTGIMSCHWQAAALLLFNNADRLSYSEIMTQLNLAHGDIARLLHSLSCAKYKILIKEPNNKVISQNDVFKFNYKFTDKMRRIKIPLTPYDERKEVIEDVDKDRRYAIDASIVRIMKRRKVLDLQRLVLECRYDAEVLQSL
ncbi:hypothetical protein VNO80_04626 [Phaseolus coccineus]|uniref:Cullin family profile domain-containing protein n=1 Tax=Phaseolus coccineus TaxID=3886 RepID=A0AAN9RRX6_PHACN